LEPNRRGSEAVDGYVLDLADVGSEDLARVGGKNASLGEMLRALAGSGIRVPQGFATTAEAYRLFLRENRLIPRIEALLGGYKSGDSSLAEAGAAIRKLMLESTFPDELAAAVLGAYQALAREQGWPNPAVAVRSSATAEDLPEASFAGQQESFLNIRGPEALIAACRRCYASLFTDRAISYRESRGFGHLDVALSVGVQLMVGAGSGASGVMFTIDTETGFTRVVTISAAFGLGEPVVQGAVDPDKYQLFKPLLADPSVSPIIERTLGRKEVKLVCTRGRGGATRLVRTTAAERRSFVLDESEIVELGRWGVLVERHYGRPMDMEWAKDGATGLLYLLQARPETVEASRRTDVMTLYRLTGKGRRLLTGSAVGTAASSGSACIIRDPADIARFRDGAILVTERTDPDWVPVMKRAAGIVAEHGGTTSHAAIVSRELGLPAIVGAEHATSVLKEGQIVTLSCAEGEHGHVYEGAVPFVREEVDLASVAVPATRMMVNLADPAAAFRWWRLPAGGVGLARMEFIINALIKVHPMALVRTDRLTPMHRREIDRLARGHNSPTDYFIATLASGIAKLASVFHPHPAIVRLSDFKTNEYAHLVGGAPFEPREENPMLGFRGACRYYDERYREGFALECRALRRVREHIGFSNVIVMVPFCRTPAEADRVLETMAEFGLTRGERGLQVYMMCEIPSNVILAEEFARRFDGFSIGSNDLTQLVLGADRDSELLAGLFDERDEAVKRMIAEAVAKAHRAGIKIGICGQAPSNHPEFAAFLAGLGIDSISLNPDSFVRTARAVAEAEGRLSARQVA
jgi:pyruvate,water dikinase